MPPWLSVRLSCEIACGLAVAIFIGLAFHWKHTMTARGQKLEIICKSTREAADNPKLDCGNVVVQIQQLGTAVKTTTDALNAQNAKVAALGKASADQQAAAKEAVSKAQGRAQKAEATANRLIASSRSGNAPAGSVAACKPSKALTEVWP